MAITISNSSLLQCIGTQYGGYLAFEVIHVSTTLLIDGDFTDTKKKEKYQPIGSIR